MWWGSGTSVGATGLGDAQGLVTCTSAVLMPLADGRACDLDSLILAAWAGRCSGGGGGGALGVRELPSWFAG